MGEGFPLFPEQASTIAEGVDQLYAFLVAVSVFFSVLIFALIFYCRHSLSAPLGS